MFLSTIVVMLLDVLVSTADVRPILDGFLGEHKELSLGEDQTACDHML